MAHFCKVIPVTQNGMVLAEAPTLLSLARALNEATSDSEKLDLLDALPSVQSYFLGPSLLRTFLSGLSAECELALKSVVAIDQAHIFSFHAQAPSLRLLLEDLLAVERFYKDFGGIVGYQATMLELLTVSDDCAQESVTFLSPEGVDISVDSTEVRMATFEGILRLPELGEIYPLGGAGDRLNLVDEKSGRPLPAATLPFCGKSLIEGLLDDLKAREYLHYQLTGKRVVTPVAIMTSRDQENHPKIIQLLDAHGWFGRPKESFKLFRQPLVPVLDEAGKWCLKGDGQSLMKPGGHGVIWKLAKEEGIFDWFYAQGRKKALLRQVNNPIAGIDHGLLAFTGLGLRGDKSFGFSSCDRLVGAKEGMNVLIQETRCDGGYQYALKTIEYCDFQKHGLEDKPVRPGSPYSQFPSNTNILFVDLEKVEAMATEHPVPGMLINRKLHRYLDSRGNPQEGKVARLESTMQNISDYVLDTFSAPLPRGARGNLSTFVTFNKRLKTISCTKLKYRGGNSFLETPEGAFADLIKNGRELLVYQCGWEVPEASSAAEIVTSGPSCLFLYHPMLGPLYSIIAQKLRRGRLANRSELQLQISHIEMNEVSIEGSVHLIADKIESGACSLKRVTFHNEGIDFAAQNAYWKNAIQRKGCFILTIHGNGEFIAQDVHFEGAYNLVVPAGMRIIARQSGKKVELSQEPISTPSGKWRYTVTTHHHIKLSRYTEICQS